MVIFNSFLCKRWPGRVSRTLRVGWLQLLQTNDTERWVKTAPALFRANDSNSQLRLINPLTRKAPNHPVFFWLYYIHIYTYTYIWCYVMIYWYTCFFWLGISRLASNLGAMGITGDMVPSPAIPHGKESGGENTFLDWVECQNRP